MKRRSLAVAFALASFCAACNFIIAASFDGYELGNPSLNGPACALVAADAGNECNECITTECKNEIASGCDPATNDKQQWFTQIASCAKQYQTSATNFDISWGCGSFLELSDASVVISNPSGADQLKNNAFLCVRDKCLNGENAGKCRQCVIAYKEGDGTEHRIGDKKESCATCIADNCSDVITRNCSNTSVLKPCAYIGNLDNKAACAAFIASDAGTPKADAAPTKNQEIHACVQQCASQCK